MQNGPDIGSMCIHRLFCFVVASFVTTSACLDRRSWSMELAEHTVSNLLTTEPVKGVYNSWLYTAAMIAPYHSPVRFFPAAAAESSVLHVSGCDSDEEPKAGTKIVSPMKEDGVQQSSTRNSSIVRAMMELPATGKRTIYLRTGIYREPKSIVLDASATDLAIVACPGETPVVTSPSSAIIIRGAQRIVLEGLAFRGDAPTLVSIESSQDCLVVQNTFVGGGTAVLLSKAAGDVVRGNLVLSSGASGIELQDQSDDNIISDNVVDGAQAPETHGGGIFLHGAARNRIIHNLVQNTAGFGIGIANWDASTVNVANVIEYNTLRNTAMAASDSGAIYLLGRSGADTQTVIAGNVVDKVGSPERHSVGIYLDDSTNGTVVTGNIVRNPGSDAIQIHGGSDNVITNNLLDLGGGRPSAFLFQAAPADTNPSNAQTGNVIVGNAILSRNPAPKVFAWLDGGNPSIAGNLYMLTGEQSLPVGSIPSDTHPIFAPPPAGDAAADHYRLVQEVARDLIGFRPIDPQAAAPRHQ